MIDVNADSWHHNSWVNADGTCYRVRRNGATQTWKTRPGEFRIPVKHGLYDYGQIFHYNADQWHNPGDGECVIRCGHRNVKVAI